MRYEQKRCPAFAPRNVGLGDIALLGQRESRAETVKGIEYQIYLSSNAPESGMGEPTIELLGHVSMGRERIARKIIAPRTT